MTERPREALTVSKRAAAMAKGRPFVRRSTTRSMRAPRGVRPAIGIAIAEAGREEASARSHNALA